MNTRTLAAALVAAAVLLGAAPAVADTRVVGDSLARQTYAESGGWYVNARDGRSLRLAGGLVHRTATKHQPTALVVALGSNDVAGRSQRMRQSISAAVALPVDCVVLTTVKVSGVTAWYGPNWARLARRWNRHVWRSGAVVANWKAHSQGHPEWFLGDGLHLTDAGMTAYDQLLRDTVANRC